MLNGDGVFVGQICHIEAAEEGGERFNPAMSDDERAAFPNLMLMCYEHHVTTNEMSVQVLRRMKAEHEAKFTDPAQAILDGEARQRAGDVVQIGDANRASDELLPLRRLASLLPASAATHRAFPAHRWPRTLLAPLPGPGAIPELFPRWRAPAQ